MTRGPMPAAGPPPAPLGEGSRRPSVWVVGSPCLHVEAVGELLGRSPRWEVRCSPSCDPADPGPPPVDVVVVVATEGNPAGSPVAAVAAPVVVLVDEGPAWEQLPGVVAVLGPVTDDRRLVEVVAGLVSGGEQPAPRLVAGG